MGYRLPSLKTIFYTIYGLLCAQYAHLQVSSCAHSYDHLDTIRSLPAYFYASRKQEKEKAIYLANISVYFCDIDESVVQYFFFRKRC